MIFRKAVADDIEKIENIYLDIHTCEEAGLTEIGWKREVYPTRLTALRSLDRGDLFVAEENGEVVGSAIINHEQVEEYKYGRWQYAAEDDEVMVLHTLVISPKSSGKGYGKKFVDFYEQYAKSLGCKYLRMDTNLKNIRARELYKKLGYTEIGQVDCVFNGITGVKMILLEKSIENT